MEARKSLGLRVLLFLAVFAGLLYFTKKRVWKRVHDEAHA
ncbi:MAG: cytochrome c1 [Beijerinckiaceae bacterium]